MASQFDWYKLSLLDPQKPQIQKFESIIRTGNISKGLDRVPTSYRKNLLIMFQNISHKIKLQTKSMASVNESLSFKKNAVANRLEQMQSSLEESKVQLVRMKSVVIEKKKMVKKLQEKIETLKKNKTQQNYFCPFCSRNDFTSIEMFTFHMFSEHQTYKAENQQSQKFSMPNNSLSLSAHNQLKDFIMTLKDKQMEMMKMILSQKKQMQTQELEKFYERQMNLMTMKNKSEPQYLSGNKYSMSQQISQDGYGQDVNLGANNHEIHGQSQFLFYQKSQKYKQAAQKEEYSLRKALEQRKKQLNSHPYYDIFKNMQENKSLNVDAQYLEQQNSKRMAYPSDSLEEYQPQGSVHNETTGFKILSKFNLKSNGQLNTEQKPPVQPLRMTSNNLKFQEFNPSITDRLKEQERKNYQSNSIYSGFGKNPINKKSSFTQQEHVFSSGILVDDNGGHSDYEDYFGNEITQKQKIKDHKTINAKIQENESINFNLSKETHAIQKLVNTEESLIQDEEIRLNPGSYSFVSKSSFSKNHISELLSPNKDQGTSFRLGEPKISNDKYKIYQNSHQKSSEIVDLSDSFSRRDFQLSKDQQSINLSDLKLSKLQKKRLQQKQKLKIQPKNSSPTYAKIRKDQEESSEGNFSKKPLQFVLISEERPFNIAKSAQSEQKINLLTQFQKKVDTPKPLLPEGYSFQQQSYELNQFYKQSSPSSNNFHQYRNSQESYRQSKLNQFMKIDYSRNENTSPNLEEQNLKDRALSPHQSFAQQIKKYQFQPTNFQVQSSSNYNQQSFVSHSSSSQPPRVNMTEYQRPLSKNKRESYEQIQQKISKETEQRSSVRNRKRLQRHEDLQEKDMSLQDDGGDLLNEFFKRQFQGKSKESQRMSNEQSSQKNRKSYNSSESDNVQIRESKKISSQKISSNYYKSNKESHDNNEGSALDEFIR